MGTPTVTPQSAKPNIPWWQIVTLILGEAEQIVPIFIHNPQSQKIEGIVVTTVNSAVGGLAQLQTSQATPPATS